MGYPVTENANRDPLTHEGDPLLATPSIETFPPSGNASEWVDP